MPAGRPTKYKPEYCERVIELGRAGKSRAQTCAILDIAIETLANWEKAHPEFLAATTRARELAQAWWEDQGQDGLTADKFNAQLWWHQVRNRFPADYRDKQEHEHTGKDGGDLLPDSRQLARAIINILGAANLEDGK